MSADLPSVSAEAVEVCRVDGVSCEVGGRRVLDQVTVGVRAGEVLALVGPNGAGKSTLLGVLLGDVTVSEGDVTLRGQAPHTWGRQELARQRSVLLQSNQVAFGFTVRAIVEMGRAPWSALPESACDEAIVEQSLRRTDTSHLVNRTFMQLSGGERARVSLARVLAQDTDVILLDEPTAALDLGHTEVVMGLARELAAEGRAVAVVVHDLSLAAAYADRVGLLDGGRLVAIGDPASVLTAERIEAVYDLRVWVLRGPDGQLLITPKRTLAH